MTSILFQDKTPIAKYDGEKNAITLLDTFDKSIEENHLTECKDDAISLFETLAIKSISDRKSPTLQHFSMLLDDMRVATTDKRFVTYIDFDYPDYECDKLHKFVVDGEDMPDTISHLSTKLYAEPLCDVCTLGEANMFRSQLKSAFDELDGKGSVTHTFTSASHDIPSTLTLVDTATL